MKATGIVRKVDELGRIVLPMELRKTMDIGDGSSLEIFVDEDFIMLRKYNTDLNAADKLNTLIKNLSEFDLGDALPLLQQAAALLTAKK